MMGRWVGLRKGRSRKGMFEGGKTKDGNEGKEQNSIIKSL